ncbi:unnamed protein product, partial [marine sediment metagenome]
GVPIDVLLFERLRLHWDQIKNKVIQKADQYYNVFEKGVFKNAKFSQYLNAHNIEWKLTPTGRPLTKAEYFEDQVVVYPELRRLYEATQFKSKMRAEKMSIGVDGRNRGEMWAFGTKTGRNAPSTNSCIFAAAKWLRMLIKPPKGQAVAYLDYSQQEIAVAAVLSKDKVMQKGYESGDFYLAFAKEVKAIPKEGTKKTYPEVRRKYKAIALGVHYGKGAYRLGKELGITEEEAKILLGNHKITYFAYWDWIDRFILNAQVTGKVLTWDRWPFYTKKAKFTTLLNYPMQATAASMFRLAVILCYQEDIKVVAMVHDAILIEAPIESIEQEAKKAKQCMIEASKIILEGFPLRVDETIIKYPERYQDEEGFLQWKENLEHLRVAEKAEMGVIKNAKI